MNQKEVQKVYPKKNRIASFVYEEEGQEPLTLEGAELLAIFQNVLDDFRKEATAKNKSKVGNKNSISNFEDWFNLNIGNQRNEIKITIEKDKAYKVSIDKTESGHLMFSTVKVREDGQVVKCEKYAAGYADLAKQLTLLSRRKPLKNPTLTSNNSNSHESNDHYIFEDILAVASGKKPTHYTEENEIQLFCEIAALIFGVESAVPGRDQEFTQFLSMLLMFDMAANQKTYSAQQKPYLICNVFDTGKFHEGQWKYKRTKEPGAQNTNSQSLSYALIPEDVHFKSIEEKKEILPETQSPFAKIYGSDNIGGKGSATSASYYKQSTDMYRSKDGVIKNVNTKTNKLERPLGKPEDINNKIVNNRVIIKVIKTYSYWLVHHFKPKMPIGGNRKKLIEEVKNTIKNKLHSFSPVRNQNKVGLEEHLSLSQYMEKLFVEIKNPVSDISKIQELLGKDRYLVYLKDKNGNTALHHAASLGKKEIIELLMKQGGEHIKNEINKKNETPLEMFKKNNRNTDESIISLLSNSSSSLGQETASNTKVIDIFKSTTESTLETTFMSNLDVGRVEQGTGTIANNLPKLKSPVLNIPSQISSSTSTVTTGNNSPKLKSSLLSTPSQISSRTSSSSSNESSQAPQNQSPKKRMRAEITKSPESGEIPKQKQSPENKKIKKQEEISPEMKEKISFFEDKINQEKEPTNKDSVSKLVGSESSTATMDNLPKTESKQLLSPIGTRSLRLPNSSPKSPSQNVAVAANQPQTTTTMTKITSLNNPNTHATTLQPQPPLMTPSLTTLKISSLKLPFPLKPTTLSQTISHQTPPPIPTMHKQNPDESKQSSPVEKGIKIFQDKINQEKNPVLQATTSAVNPVQNTTKTISTLTLGPQTPQSQTLSSRIAVTPPKPQTMTSSSYVSILQITDQSKKGMPSHESKVSSTGNEKKRRGTKSTKYADAEPRPGIFCSGAFTAW